MMPLFKYLGMKGEIIFSWRSLVCAQLGGDGHSGGMEWNFNSRPLVMIRHATSSPKPSQAGRRRPRVSSHDLLGSCCPSGREPQWFGDGRNPDTAAGTGEQTGVETPERDLLAGT